MTVSRVIVWVVLVFVGWLGVSTVIAASDPGALIAIVETPLVPRATSWPAGVAGAERSVFRLL